MANIPDPTIDQGVEDVESIDNDIDNLYNKFMAPIDKIRSIAEAPKDQIQSNKKQKTITDLKVDTVNGLESRISAFYRMIGFPVVAGDSFYNPGFNPIPQIKTRDSINSKVIMDGLNIREQIQNGYNQLFNEQGFESTLFSKLLRYPKSFSLAKIDGKQVTQSQSIEARARFIDELSINNSDLEGPINTAKASFQKRMGFDISSTKHPLRPFVTNPIIDFTVMPSDNKVCVPFLPILQSTKISTSPDVYLPRPGLEFIIRARLKDSHVDTTFLNDVKNIFSKTKSPSSAGSSDASILRSTIEALSDKNKFDVGMVDSIFAGFNSVQIIMVTELVKTIKVVIKILHDSIIELDKIDKEISFYPIPSAQGLVGGGTLRDVVSNTQLERNITNLTVRKMNAQRDVNVERALGEYATPFMDLQRVSVYEEQLQNLNRKKTEISNRGFQCLKNISIITGEGIGIGLVDILAIYTALWAISIEELLGFLDQDSFDRLYNYNVNLRSTEVNNRKNGTIVPISKVLSSFDTKVSNILSFADLSLSSQFNSQSEQGQP